MTGLRAHSVFAIDHEFARWQHGYLQCSCILGPALYFSTKEARSVERAVRGTRVQRPREREREREIRFLPQYAGHVMADCLTRGAT
eukprot:5447508-Prymnesium_polylepis.1